MVCGTEIAAVVCAFVSSVIWFVVDYVSGHVYSLWLIGFSNALLRLVSFIIIGVAFSYLKKRLEREQELIVSLNKALNEVKQLSGLLPICASCKKIKDSRGNWTQIESYIRDHSEAEFSHGICPNCAKKLYPDFYQNGDDSEV